MALFKIADNTEQLISGRFSSSANDLRPEKPDVCILTNDE